MRIRVLLFMPRILVFIVTLAAASLSFAAEDRSESYQDRLVQIRSLLKAKQHTEAADAASAAIKAEPDRFEAYAMRALALSAKNDLRRAEADLVTAAKLAPEDKREKINDLLADVRIAQARTTAPTTQKAPTTRNTAAADKPLSPDQLVTLQAAELALADAEKAAAKQDLAKAREYADEAIATLSPLLKANQNNLRVWRAAAAAATVKEDAALASRAYAAITKIKPDFADDTELLKLMARLRRLQKNVLDYSTIVAALKREPQDPERKEAKSQISQVARTGDVAGLKAFIDAGGDINVILTHDSGSPQWTLLYWAADNNKLDAVTFLITAGANVNLTGVARRNPLHCAVRHGNAEMLKQLIKAGADVNAQDYSGDAPVHYAAMEKNIDAVKLLVAAKCDVNLKNDFGDTPLIEACKAESLDVAKILVEAGVEINATNTGGRSALFFVESRELRAYLKEHGAKGQSRRE